MNQPQFTQTQLELPTLTISPNPPPTSSDQLGEAARRMAIESIRQVADNLDDGPINQIEAKIKSMRQELQYDHANTFDQLLIEQVLTAWVQWYSACWLLDGDLVKNRTLAENNYFSRRYNQCQIRLDKAIAHLSKVRQIDQSRFHITTPEDLAERKLKRAQNEAEYESQRLKMEQEIEEEYQREQAEEDED